jgi:predicted nucleic acid-binding Zn ribbon protein
MRRRALTPISGALDVVTTRLAPATLLAEVQRAWPEAAGPGVAPHGEPWAERDGEVFVACPEAVWAQELDLMSEAVVEQLNRVLGRPAVRRLRVQARKAPSRDG